MVRLDYTIDLDFEVNAPAEFVLAVAAAMTPSQRVVTEHVHVNLPATTRWSTDPHFGNRLLHLRVDPGALHVAYASAHVAIDRHPGNGFRLPQASVLAVSTAASNDPCASPAVDRDTSAMPFLLQPLRAVQAIRGAR
ncbi:MAG: hypothetical protein ABI190_07235 [Casimicrobiaceae bacterium]